MSELDSTDHDEYTQAEDAAAEDADMRMLFALKKDFTVCTEEDADYITNRMAAIEREMAARKEAYRLHQAALQRKLDWLKLRYTGQLETFLRGQLEGANGKTKSVLLPCGARLGFRKSPVTFVVDDHEVYSTWAQTTVPEAVDWVCNVSKSTINTYLKETGEVPDGTHYEGGDDVFTLKL